MNTRLRKKDLRDLNKIAEDVVANQKKQCQEQEERVPVRVFARRKRIKNSM